ncbi:MAG: phytanoyl-CoA dioxygenase family protein [Planctomyces sp.]|nr:phytanoyl-CoA dioxygenase family protein [Planctomyces sp.]
MFATEESAATYAGRIDHDGFAVIEGVLGNDEVSTLRQAVETLGEREEVLRRGSIYGVRNLLEVLPAAAEVAAHPALRSLVRPVLGDGCFAVRGTLFDKNAGANWSLFWHQDSIITVREKRETPGFSKWSQKAGVWHVEPPHEVFEQMLTLRLHLDDCGPDNGPLRVLGGSHRCGWVDDEIEDWKRSTRETVCTAAAGGVVVMRPLLLHASSASASPSHRRVLHIEYAATDLAGELEWNTRISGA